MRRVTMSEDEEVDEEGDDERGCARWTLKEEEVGSSRDEPGRG